MGVTRRDMQEFIGHLTSNDKYLNQDDEWFFIMVWHHAVVVGSHVCVLVFDDPLSFHL